MRTGKYDAKLKMLLDGVVDVEKIMEEFKMRRSEFDRWMSRPRAVGVVNRACRVQQSRVRLILAHARADAVARLREMALQKEDPDLARRACVDLVRISAGVLGQGRGKDRTKEEEEALAKEAERERVVREAAERLRGEGMG